MKRNTLVLYIIGMAVLLVLVDWYFVSPLFFKREVENPYPDEYSIPLILTATPRSTLIPPPSRLPKQTPNVIATPIPTETVEIEAIQTESTPVQQAPIEATPTTPPKHKQSEPISPTPTAPSSKFIIVQGNFVDGSLTHQSTGLATLYHTPNGSYQLHLDDFVVTNDPHLRVLLSPNETPTDQASLGEYIELGALKDNIGDQIYAIPAHIDPTRYKSVVIHCFHHQMIFAIATLN